jgi:hypothetical protein
MSAAGRMGGRRDDAAPLHALSYLPEARIAVQVALLLGCLPDGRVSVAEGDHEAVTAWAPD